jgi:hypothetical protein
MAGLMMSMVFPSDDSTNHKVVSGSFIEQWKKTDFSIEEETHFDLFRQTHLIEGVYTSVISNPGMKMGM